jgi:hypothetical protein
VSVYFIEAVGRNLVKIGYAGDPEKRLAELRSASPDDLQLLFSVPGDKATEAEYHRKYRHLRVRPNGEWFHFDGKLKQFIDAAMMCAGETYQGLPVLRGILVGLTGSWYKDPDGKTEHRGAYLLVWCPECDQHHQHSWDPRDGVDVLKHKRAHCDPGSAFKKGGYYVGLVKQVGVHCCTPGKAITSPRGALAGAPRLARGRAKKA